MSDIKNLIITILLSTLILIGWQYFYETPKKNTELQQVKTDDKAAGSVKNDPIESLILNRDQAITYSEEQRVKIDNGKVKGSINLKGARIDDLLLEDYNVTLNNNSKKVVLLSPSNTKESYFAEFGWVSNSDNIELPTSETLWHANKKEISDNEPLILTWQNNSGITFTIVITIDHNYMFKIDQKIDNHSNFPIVISNYATINKQMVEIASPYSILHEGPIGVFKSILYEAPYKDLKSEEKKLFNNNNGGDWLGISDKYWLTAIIPHEQSNFSTNIFRKTTSKKEMFQADYVSQAVTLHPGHLHENHNHFFAGAKKLKLLDEYAKNLHITLFDRAVDFGWFYFLTKPMFYALQILNSILGNFGLAILAVTVLVKLGMYPFASKSFASMNKMKKLQPQLVSIRGRFENDKMQMNKEIMELYKKEGINPLSGCLPLLIQIPVFFSLYKVLFVSLEMRHAPFFGWIHDLSAPDPTSLFNLFGLIPWSPPAFLVVGAWPIIMSITMYFQQKMNPEPADPVQAQVMKFLPVIFLFMFNSFPSGLIIYWAWNNVLSILQQWWINRKNEI
jgi:YidC/Oxa1 family membrane protein insertase